MTPELVVRNGRLVTASEEFFADIAVSGGRITGLGRDLPRGRREIDAGGRMVTPGGVDAHCHIDEPPYLNARLADDFRSASRSAACGGTTTIVPFINQLADATLEEAREDYMAKAQPSLIDYAFHLILKNAGKDVLRRELPPLLRAGLRSVKVFMTYPGYMMDDEAILDVMGLVREVDGIVMVHAENGHCAHWAGAQLEQAGETGLSHFRDAFPPAIEREATHRAITLAELTDTRLMVVHVSGAEAMEQIRWSRARGHRTLAETCPQYLMDLGRNMQTDDWETAKFMCSPPVREPGDAEALWRALALRDLDLVSSDHCPYRFEGTDGKKAFGNPDLREVPPGLPGLELRMPLTFEQGVVRGRMSASRFVELTATRPAQIYGLYPRKGSLMPGADADIVIWDTDAPRRVAHADMHDACDYTPYEGEEISAWPAITLSRGEVIWQDGKVSDDHGRGQFIPAQDV